MSTTDISQTAARARARGDLLRRGESRLRLQTIVRLRWLAVLGQSATVVVVYWLMQMGLHGFRPVDSAAPVCHGPR